MPVYDYKCTDCGTVYDIFHKVREIPEDVICPSCSSRKHTRLLSAPNFSMKAQKQPTPPCGDASCCGGNCSFN
ncbi:zinc ribbon domain-containing protein [bacterium]|nr:MAG: zinc ribbon domain-containing protein [bacterium]